MVTDLLRVSGMNCKVEFVSFRARHNAVSAMNVWLTYLVVVTSRWLSYAQRMLEVGVLAVVL